MAAMQNLEDKIDAIKSDVAAVDSLVEQMFQTIKEFTNNGITEEASNKLLAKLEEVQTAVQKVGTDDEPVA